QREELTLAHLQRDAVDRHQGAKALGDGPELDVVVDGLVAHWGAPRLPNHRRPGNRCGRSPVQAGMKTVIAITLAALAAGCGSAPAAGTRPPAGTGQVTHA